MAEINFSSPGLEFGCRVTNPSPIDHPRPWNLCRRLVLHARAGFQDPLPKILLDALAAGQMS